MDLRLVGRIALVTGASRGIGRSIAVTLAQEGVAVGICARDSESLDAVCAEITACGVQCAVAVGDLRDAGECRRVVDEVASSLGGLDILINNASANVETSSRCLDHVTDDQLTERLTGKFLPAARCSRAALPYLRSSEGGRIIFIGGLSARTTPIEANGPITATSMIAGIGNAAISNFAKSLADQVAVDGILVNVVHPGSTRTDRFLGRVARKAAELEVSNQEAEAIMAGTLPLGRIVAPIDIAPLVAFLASPLASAITGQAIAVDGGGTSVVVY